MVVGMETSIHLSLSVLIRLLIFSVIHGVSILVARRHKNIVDQSPARDESVLKKNINICGGSARVFIPNVLAKWPWPSQINPNYATVKKEADAWMASSQAFSPKAQDAYERCNSSMCFLAYPASMLISRIGLLACLAYPTASKGKLIAGAVTWVRSFT